MKQPIYYPYHRFWSAESRDWKYGRSNCFNCTERPGYPFCSWAPDFDILSASRTMETVRYMPVGFHVCVVDPGVGTARKPIILQVKRGDYFIGPDNGIFLSAAHILGG